MRGLSRERYRTVSSNPTLSALRPPIILNIKGFLFLCGFYAQSEAQMLKWACAPGKTVDAGNGSAIYRCRAGQALDPTRREVAPFEAHFDFPQFTDGTVSALWDPSTWLA